MAHTIRGKELKDCSYSELSNRLRVYKYTLEQSIAGSEQMKTIVLEIVKLQDELRLREKQTYTITCPECNGLPIQVKCGCCESKGFIKTSKPIHPDQSIKPCLDKRSVTTTKFNLFVFVRQWMIIYFHWITQIFKHRCPKCDGPMNNNRTDIINGSKTLIYQCVKCKSEFC